MLEFLIQLIPTLMILGLLIFVHELGHFLACRLTRVGVEKFSIGFGPELLAWQGKGTRYSLSLIPFGGFVKPQGESEDEVQKRGQTRVGDFVAAPVLSRILVIVAGVLMNYLLAYVLFVWIFVSGRPIIGTTIGSLIQGYPAQASGLVVGDKIISVNGKSVTNWQDLTYEISKSNRSTIDFTVVRTGEIEIVSVEPKFESGKDIFGTQQRIPKVGIMPDTQQVMIERYDFKNSLVEAWQLEWRLSLLTYEAIGKLFTGQMSLKTISGPIGIVAMAGSALKIGFGAVLQLTALLSVSLAVINLLPIPALDGGHLLFLLPEIIFRKKISPVVQERVTQYGFYFLIALMVLVVFNDLVNLGILERLRNLFVSKTPAFPQ